MKEEIKKWWDKAKDDLEKAKILAHNNKYDGAVFYCQQSIEKALKSLIIKKDNKIKKIHDLVELGKDVKLPDNLLNYCKEITQSYIYSRYPDIEEPKEIKEISLSFIEHTIDMSKTTSHRLVACIGWHKNMQWFLTLNIQLKWFLSTQIPYRLYCAAKPLILD